MARDHTSSLPCSQAAELGRDNDRYHSVIRGLSASGSYDHGLSLNIMRPNVSAILLLRGLVVIASLLGAMASRRSDRMEALAFPPAATTQEGSLRRCSNATEDGDPWYKVRTSKAIHKAEPVLTI